MQELFTGLGLKPPRNLTLMITGKCNLQCCHCWPESGPAGNRHHVDRDRLLPVIDDFRKLGIDKVCLTGGEPLLHPHWQDILDFCLMGQGFKEVCLQTNATLLTAENVRQLASYSRHNLIIQVSLEGAGAKTHDRMRGIGSFARALKGLVLLAEFGLAEQTRVSLTETKDNFLELPDLLKLINSLGIRHLASGTLVMGGRAAKENGQELEQPTPLQYQSLLQRLHTDADFKKLCGKPVSIAPLEWHKGRADSAAPGCSFVSNPYITADGTLYPCVMFQIDEYAAHDIYSRPLAEILQEIMPIWAKLQEESVSRPDRLQACSNCPGKSHCRGGCMGRAYMAHGSLMSVEDRCSLRRAVYRWSGDCSENQSISRH